MRNMHRPGTHLRSLVTAFPEILWSLLGECEAVAPWGRAGLKRAVPVYGISGDAIAPTLWIGEL